MMAAGSKEWTRIRNDAPGKTIAFISGNFNVVHPGHIRLLKFARAHADMLVVGLYADGQNTYVPQELRLASLRTLDMVDETFVVADDIRECVEALRPDLIVKGAEHETRINPEEKWLATWGGKLIFCTDDPKFSLNKMLDGMLRKREQNDGAAIPRGYLQRHAISATSLTRLFTQIAGLRVCVIGDLIVDEYVICNPLGMSREDPTLVVTPLEETRFVGGAGIVAGHAAKMAKTVRLISVAGNDPAAEYASEWLGKCGIDAAILPDPTRPTTVKRRYRAQNKTLLRVNRLTQQHVDRRIQEQIEEQTETFLPETDLLIFSDFSYGVLPRALVERITKSCLRQGVVIAADSQTSSQIGDLSKFGNAALITPTEIEARHAVNEFSLGLTALSQRLMDELKTKNCIITLAESGCLISGDPAEHTLFTDNLPALNSRPVDVAGAGDSFLTLAALAMAAKSDVWHAALLGSVAASIQVGRMGNIPLAADEVREKVRQEVPE